MRKAPATKAAPRRATTRRKRAAAPEKGRNGTAGRGKGHSTLTTAQREQALALLCQDPPLDGQAVARAVGCSYHAVRHLKDKLLQPGKVADRVLGEYGRRFHRKLPVKTRVKLYADLAEGKISSRAAFSQLKALQRIEELEGVVTERERKEAESKDRPAAPGPVFIIAGASVSVQPARLASGLPIAQNPAPPPPPVVVDAENVELRTSTELVHSGLS